MSESTNVIGVNDEITRRDMLTVLNLYRSVCLHEILVAIWTVAALFSYGLKMSMWITGISTFTALVDLIALTTRRVELEAVIKSINKEEKKQNVT